MFSTFFQINKINEKIKKYLYITRFQRDSAWVICGLFASFSFALSALRRERFARAALRLSAVVERERVRRDGVASVVADVVSWRGVVDDDLRPVPSSFDDDLRLIESSFASVLAAVMSASAAAAAATGASAAVRVRRREPEREGVADEDGVVCWLRRACAWATTRADDAASNFKRNSTRRA